MTLFIQRRQAAMSERKSEARRLRERGVGRKEIAARLGCSVYAVNEYLWMGNRAAEPPANPRISREEKAAAMAAVYPDDERQDWIYRQMGVERDAVSVPDEAGRGEL